MPFLRKVNVGQVGLFARVAMLNEKNANKFALLRNFRIFTILTYF